MTTDQMPRALAEMLEPLVALERATNWVAADPGSDDGRRFLEISHYGPENWSVTLFHEGAGPENWVTGDGVTLAAAVERAFADLEVVTP